MMYVCHTIRIVHTVCGQEMLLMNLNNSIQKRRKRQKDKKTESMLLLRCLIQETLLDMKKGDIEEGHEDLAEADIVQLNRQDNGDKYDQMRRIKTHKKRRH